MQVTVNVRIPTQLRGLSGGVGEVGVSADDPTVHGVLRALCDHYSGFEERLFDEGGVLRRFVNVFVADEDVRFLDGLSTRLAGGETVSIVPAVAGG